MKKTALLGVLAVASVFAFATGCNKNTIADGTYEGNYVEATQWATYTANVEVTVADGKITEVVLKDDSVIHSPTENWTGHAAWTDHVNEILASYVGLDAAKVAKSETAPVDALAGATLSSDRLFLAVKDALTVE